MGGCATKPKDLKPESGKSPEQAPEAPAENNEADTIKEVVEAEKKIEEENVDEQGSKRRSLSLLFKENEEPKSSIEDVKVSSTEQEKEEEPHKVEKAVNKNSEVKLQEDKEAGNSTKSISAEDAVHDPKTETVENVHYTNTLIEQDETTKEKETEKEETEIQAESIPSHEVVYAPKKGKITEEKETEKKEDWKVETTDRKETKEEEDRKDETEEKKETDKEEIEKAIRAEGVQV